MSDIYSTSTCDNKPLADKRAIGGGTSRLITETQMAFVTEGFDGSGASLQASLTAGYLYQHGASGDIITAVSRDGIKTFRIGGGGALTPIDQYFAPVPMSGSVSSSNGVDRIYTVEYSHATKSTFSIYEVHATTGMIALLDSFNLPFFTDRFTSYWEADKWYVPNITTGVGGELQMIVFDTTGDVLSISSQVVTPPSGGQPAPKVRSIRLVNGFLVTTGDLGIVATNTLDLGFYANGDLDIVHVGNVIIANGPNSVRTYLIDGAGNLTHVASQSSSVSQMAVFGDNVYFQRSSFAGDPRWVVVSPTGTMTQIDQGSGFSFRGGVVRVGDYVYLTTREDHNSLSSLVSLDVIRTLTPI